MIDILLLTVYDPIYEQSYMRAHIWSYTTIYGYDPRPYMVLYMTTIYGHPFESYTVCPWDVFSGLINIDSAMNVMQMIILTYICSNLQWINAFIAFADRCIFCVLNLRKICHMKRICRSFQVNIWVGIKVSNRPALPIELVCTGKLYACRG